MSTEGSTEGSIGLKLAGSAFRGASQGPLLTLVVGNALGNGVSVDSQGFGGFRQVVFVSRERLFYIEFFKFFKRFGQQDLAVEHFLNQDFKTRVHVLNTRDRNGRKLEFFARQQPVSVEVTGRRGFCHRFGKSRSGRPLVPL